VEGGTTLSSLPYPMSFSGPTMDGRRLHGTSLVVDDGLIRCSTWSCPRCDAERLKRLFSTMRGNRQRKFLIIPRCDRPHLCIQVFELPTPLRYSSLPVVQFDVPVSAF
jgi:hypothetical protein